MSLSHGVPKSVVMSLCAGKKSSLAEYQQLRGFIDSVINVMDNDDDVAVFYWMLKYDIVGNKIWQLLYECDNELGVFVRMIELSLVGINQDIIDSNLTSISDNQLRNYTAFQYMISKATQAKYPVKGTLKSLDKLADELLELL